MEDGLPKCPECGQSDQVRSLAAIVEEEAATPLGRMLAPPVEPVAEPRPAWARVGSWLFIAGGIISIAATLFVILPALSQGQADSQLIELSLSLVFGLGIIGGGLATMRRNAKKARRQQAHHETRLARWETAIQRWGNLYYCARDDGVFDPVENELIPAVEMIDYVER